MVPWDQTKQIIIRTPVISMTGFEQHKWIDDDWYSGPFYTHECGYKMCSWKWTWQRYTHLGIYTPDAWRV